MRWGKGGAESERPDLLVPRGFHLVLISSFRTPLPGSAPPPTRGGRPALRCLPLEPSGQPGGIDGPPSLRGQAQMSTRRGKSFSRWRSGESCAGFASLDEQNPGGGGGRGHPGTGFASLGEQNPVGGGGRGCPGTGFASLGEQDPVREGVPRSRPGRYGRTGGRGSAREAPESVLGSRSFWPLLSRTFSRTEARS